MVRQAFYIVAVGFLAACGGAAPMNEGAKVAGALPAAEARGEGPSTRPAPGEAKATATVEGSALPLENSGGSADAMRPVPSATPAGAPVLLPDLAESPGARELEAGAEAVRKEEWIKAQVRLEAALASLGPEVSADAHLVGRALLARSCNKGKSTACAEREYQKVLALWRDPAMSSRIGVTGGDEAAQRDRRGRAVLAAVEAMFYFAEQKRAELDDVRLPAFRGKNSREGVTQFVAAEVTAFIKKKQALIDEVDKAYREIVDLESAPPRWVVPALARMATMRGRFVAEMRAAPIPEAWRRPGVVPGTAMTTQEIRSFYYSSLDGAVAPIRARTKAAYEACKQQSERLGIQDDNARHCQQWLEKMGG